MAYDKYFIDYLNRLVDRIIAAPRNAENKDMHTPKYRTNLLLSYYRDIHAHNQFHQEELTKAVTKINKKFAEANQEIASLKEEIKLIKEQLSK